VVGGKCVVGGKSAEVSKKGAGEMVMDKEVGFGVR
jgi:hypothetical protein